MARNFSTLQSVTPPAIVPGLVNITPDQIRWILIRVFVLIISVALHEFGHAFMADRLGDDPPRREGRVKLNPLAPAAPTETLLLPLVETGRGGTPSVPWWVALIGLGLTGVFVQWERVYTRRGRSPLVDLALFRVPGYSPGAAVGTIVTTFARLAKVMSPVRDNSGKDCMKDQRVCK